MNKKDFEQRKEFFKYLTAEIVVTQMVNALISALYIPSKKDIKSIDKKRIKHFKIDMSEPINWLSLQCNEVRELKDGSFIVYIDEAAPKSCPTLCAYIEDYMRYYGWDVKAETEW